MNLGDFRSLAFEMSRTRGTPYPNLNLLPQANALLQEALNRYAKATGVLYSPKVAMFPQVGLSSYSTFNPKYADALVDGLGPGPVRLFASPLCAVDQVCLNNSFLLSLDDENGSCWMEPNLYGWPGSWSSKFGESSEQAIIQAYPGYLNAANGQPANWFAKGPNNIVFNCPFDSSPAAFVSGTLYHSPLTQGDSQVLDFPDEDIRLCARLARNMLLETYQPDEYGEGGAHALAMAALMETRKGEAGSRNVGNPQRQRDGRADGIWLTG